MQEVTPVPNSNQPPDAPRPEADGPKETKPPDTRVTCDTMLGKLCRSLRSLGVDAEYRRGIGGMRGYKQARGRERLFLTRSGRLKELPGVLYVESNDPDQQLVQIREKLGILAAAGAADLAEIAPSPPPPPPAPPPGSRCLDCNVALEKISRDQARPSIPFFVYQIHHDFSRCPKCRRVFWPGSHVRNMQDRSPAGRHRPRRGRPETSK